MSAETRWNLTKPASRPAAASGQRADQNRNPARVLSVIALASIAVWDVLWLLLALSVLHPAPVRRPARVVVR